MRNKSVGEKKRVKDMLRARENVLLCALGAPISSYSEPTNMATVGVPMTTVSVNVSVKTAV